jgi:hypothetical protein
LWKNLFMEKFSLKQHLKSHFAKSFLLLDIFYSD